MSDYSKLVQKEAKDFYAAQREAFLADGEEFGGKSAQPNLLRWLDRNEKLALRVQEVSEKWTPREHRWVQTNTKSKAKEGGDPASNAFASFLQDVRHAIKKIAKG